MTIEEYIAKELEEKSPAEVADALKEKIDAASAKQLASKRKETRLAEDREAIADALMDYYIDLGVLSEDISDEEYERNRESVLRVLKRDEAGLVKKADIYRMFKLFE